ncbi:hypothetical protein BC830DRAFT_1068978 [Chytriomyces sp. MP71]|nr:hypothetical protein BC830DRAFT_1068978 [Chytriomyces sp. MP71]
MKYTVPSTSVRNRFLKTLPIGTVYVDPRNSPKYKIQERKINTTLSKVGVPYFGSKEAITVTIPESMMKMKLPLLEQIKQLMNDKKWFQTDNKLFLVEKDLIYCAKCKLGDSKKIDSGTLSCHVGW